MVKRQWFSALLAALAILLLTATPALADKSGISGKPTTKPQPISAQQFSPTSTTIGGGAFVLPTTRTIAHWWGSATNPHDGITYGFNMAGANPTTCSGAGCSVTIQADITPLIVNFDGMTYDGTAVVGPTVDSPQFALNNYGSTPAATAAGAFPDFPQLIEGSGGTLSQGDSRNLLQLEDATMRAQFNRVGGSPYHLILHPNILPPVTLNVPHNQGILRESPQQVIFPTINYSWWASQINNLESTADPTHLPIYLSNDVLLQTGGGGCCVIGFHGTKSRNGGSNGNAVVQTFAWASWIRPGTYPRRAGLRLPTDWAIQDIQGLSHEISEWADDPFVNNLVEPWQTPTAPQYGCSNILETGDPVVGIGFAMGHNTFDQQTLPDGETMADGYYHPEDEVFLPWFMRTWPNTISEPTQSGSGGRYSFMGDLNPFPGFRQVATGC
jgi:hypothetical protein